MKKSKILPVKTASTISKIAEKSSISAPVTPTTPAAPAAPAKSSSASAPPTSTTSATSAAPAASTASTERPAPAASTAPTERPAPAASTASTERPAPAASTASTERPAPAASTASTERPAPAASTAPTAEAPKAVTPSKLILPISSKTSSLLPKLPSSSNVSLAETYLKVIAKHSISLHSMSRDMKVARINFQKLVKLEGGKVSKDPDAMFLSGERLEKSLSKQKEKLSPEKKKKDEKKDDDGSGIIGIIGNLGIIFLRRGLKKAFGFLKNKLFKIFSPKMLIRIVGKLAIPLLIITTLWEGITGAWEAYKETGSLWEAFKGGIGSIVEFFTFGLIDKKMVGELFGNIVDFFKPVVESIKTFFGNLGKWVGNKFNAVIALFQTKEKNPKYDEKTQALLDKQVAEFKKEEDEADKKAAAAAIKDEKERKAAQDKLQKEGAQAARDRVQARTELAAQSRKQRREENAKKIRGESQPAAAAPTPAKSTPAPAETAPSKSTSVVGGDKSSGAGASGNFSKNENLAIAKKGLNEAGITNIFAVNAALGNILKEVGKDAVPKTEDLKAYRGTDNERIRKVFGSRASKFSDAELDKIKRNEVAFGEMVYGKDTAIGRQMGNIEDGDGYKYRGRGFIQITGKNLYAKYSKSTKIDFLNNPDLMNTPELAAKTMGMFLLDGVGIKKINSFENQNEANREVTQAIGGRGLDLTKGIGAELLEKVNKYSTEVGGVESSTAPSAAAPSAAPSNVVTSGTGTPIQTGSGGYLTTKQQELPKTDNLESLVTKENSGVDLQGFKSEFSKRLALAAAEFTQQTGKKIQINSGYRSNEKQKQLWDAKLAATGGNVAETKKWVAEPAPPLGKGAGSLHTSGLAVDIQPTLELNKFISIFEKYGLKRPFSWEPWHFQLIGTPSVPDNPVEPGKPIQVAGKESGKGTNVATGKTEQIQSTPNKSEGAQISQTSTELASEQRCQQKPQTPVIVNAPTTNNTAITNNKNVKVPQIRNIASALAAAAV